MKEVLSGKNIKEIFANFSGHLHKDGHQLLAQALCAKIEQERAAMGLPGAGVTVAEKSPETKSAVPLKP
jgi:hypothetical protein